MIQPASTGNAPNPSKNSVPGQLIGKPANERGSLIGSHRIVTQYYRGEDNMRTQLLGYNGRVAEWVTSAVLFMMAINFMLPGNTLETAKAFQVFVKLGLDETMLSGIALIVSLGRMSALYVNGAWRQSPSLRLVGAIVGSTIFGILAVIFGYPYFSGQSVALSTGCSTYLVLALADNIAAYRSARDATISWAR